MVHHGGTGTTLTACAFGLPQLVLPQLGNESVWGARLADAGLVVTGEGRFDAQSLRGKAPSRMLDRARARGIETVLVAGAIDVPPDRLRGLGITSWYSLAERAGSVEVAMRDAAGLLEQLGAELAR